MDGRASKAALVTTATKLVQSATAIASDALKGWPEDEDDAFASEQFAQSFARLEKAQRNLAAQVIRPAETRWKTATGMDLMIHVEGEEFVNNPFPTRQELLRRDHEAAMMDLERQMGGWIPRESASVAK